jgi:hypothetical protein
LTNRAHIDAPAGVIDIEGEKDFVEGLLAKLFPLIEEGGFGSRSLPKNTGNELDSDSDAEIGQTDEGDVKSTKIKPKRKRNVAPKGHTCPDRIQALKEEGFFKTKKGIPDIIAGLAAKGYTHTSNQVSAAGESMFRRQAIQRSKEGKGPWMYFWDRV